VKPFCQYLQNLAVLQAALVLCLEMEQLAKIFGQSQKNYYQMNYEDVAQNFDEL
jgi:hypothetical protein